MKSREELAHQIAVYRTGYKDEKIFIPQFLDLLKSYRCFYRDHLPGHITASAWILDEEGKHVLLLRHAKLNKWLQPGGHADGDEDVLSVAMREVNEETGLLNLKSFTLGIFDLDIHPIPVRKDFPEHLHFDIRFAFLASRKEELKISDESHDLQWVSLEEVPGLTQHNTSILRMIRKVETTGS